MTSAALALLFTSVSTTLGLPSGLLSSVCYVESRYNVRAIHHDDGGNDSLGVCQVQLPTARSLGFKGTEAQLMRPATNIAYAGKILSYHLARCATVQDALMAYNSGRCGIGSRRYAVKVLHVLESEQ